MRILCASAQLPGHLDWGGFLATAVELQRRGQTLLWASGVEVAPLLRRAKVPFHQLEETGWRWPPPAPIQVDESTADAESLEHIRAERALDQWLDVNRVQRALSELLELCKSYRPDLIIAENFMSAAAIAAEVMNTPFVVAGWPALSVRTTAKTQVIADMACRRLKVLLETVEASGRNWSSAGPPALRSPLLHLTYWSPSWYRGLTFLPQTQHVGGVASGGRRANVSDAITSLMNNESIVDRPWVFITLGTSFGNDPNFFVAASEAVVQIGAVPIIALGQALPKGVDSTLEERLPSGTILLKERVPFDIVLPAIGAAIHHGGAGTARALVTHAVPQIIVPHAADQIHQAHGVTRSGVGVGIQPHKVTIEALKHFIAEMLTDSSQFQRSAHALQREFAALGGVAKAADLLVLQ